ncbi:hypothetical protein D9M73_155200 [compost metagenome]
MVGDELQFFIGLVARVFFQARWQAVRVADRFFRFEDDFFGSLGADVGQVAHDADTVHLGNDLATEAGQPAVTLVAAGAHQVLGVVAHLHDAHAQLLEHVHISDLVLERMGVLEAEEDAGLAQFLGLADVGGGAHRHDQVAVFADQFLAGSDIVDRGLETFPHRHCAVGSSEPALAHVFEQLTVPFGNNQPVDNDAVGVQFGWAHQAVPLLAIHAPNRVPALWGQHMPRCRGSRVQKRQGVCRKRQSATKGRRQAQSSTCSRPLAWARIRRITGCFTGQERRR